MGRSLATLGALVLAWMLGLGAGPLRADGMVFPIVGEAQQIEVQAPMQRALLWFREGTWEMVIQPAFLRPEGGAAWVVPFPVVPQVAEASVELLDQLELVTAPIFIPFCKPESDIGCMGGSASSSAGGVDGGTLGEAQSGAQVWDSGSTEELDWVVLEAPGPEALIQWLLENDYQVPPALEDQPEMLDQRFLFAARLREDQDPEAPLPPFRFTLPGVAYEDLEYPLQLTALAAPPEGLDLVLWVAFPNDGATLVPRDLAWQAVAGDYHYSPKQWQRARAKAEAALPEGRGLILEYNGWSLESFTDGHDWYEGDYWSPEYDLHQAGVALPATWATELREMSQANTRVMRYRGLLGADEMARDLGFKTVNGDGGGPGVSVFKYEVSCFQLELMSQGGDPVRVWPGLLLGALAVLATLVGLGTVVFLRIPRGRP